MGPLVPVRPKGKGYVKLSVQSFVCVVTCVEVGVFEYRVRDSTAVYFSAPHVPVFS